jgi:hypothetical protein
LEKAKALPAKADKKMKELVLCQAAGPGMTIYNTIRFVSQPTESAKGKKYVSLLAAPPERAMHSLVFQLVAIRKGRRFRAVEKFSICSSYRYS